MRKLGLLFSLYFCQGLPGGFLAVALPVMLYEQGASFGLIGSLVFLNLPWFLKFTWAPLADRFYWSALGRRKSWIVPAQAGIVAVTVTLAFVNPDDSVVAVACLFLVLNLFAATQDIGVDGFAVDVLDQDELGRGNAAQVSGFKLGNLTGGGVLLAASAVLGWRGAFLIMAACVAAVMTAMALTRERGLYVDDPARAEPPRLWRSVRGLGIGFWLFLFYAKFGETFAGFLVKPLLRGQGFSRPDIGKLDGIIGGLATIAGAALAGAVYRRLGLKRTLGGFAVGQGLALLALGLWLPRGPSFAQAAALNGVENFAGGGGGVCIFALAMSLTNRSVGAAQFTLAQCVYMAGAFAAPPLGGLLADRVGPLPVFVLGGAMAASLALLVSRWSGRAR